MVRTILATVIWAVCSLCWADIQCQDTYAEHEPIVVTIGVTNVPDGAKLRGSFAVTGAAYVEAGGTFYVWAAPGTHTISATGVWVLTEDVVIGERTVPVLVDFGQYTYSKQIVVGEVPDPVPPPDPTPPGTRRAVILEESDSRTNAQASLYGQLRKEFQDSRLEILDDDQSGAARYVSLAPNLPRPTLIVLAGPDSKLVRAVALPGSVEAVKQEIAR